MYSLPYLQSFVKDIGLPTIIKQLIPLVEIDINNPLDRGFAGKTTGTVNPGIIWAGKYFQLGLEAVVPINERTGKNVGVRGQIHFFLDDIFPNTLGGRSSTGKRERSRRGCRTGGASCSGRAWRGATPSSSAPSRAWAAPSRSAPSQVRAWFTEALEPAFSTLEVVNDKGERVDRGPAQVDASSRALLQVPLKPLGPGAYRVKWRVLSVDTHVTEGDFTFRVTDAP